MELIVKKTNKNKKKTCSFGIDIRKVSRPDLHNQANFK